MSSPFGSRTSKYIPTSTSEVDPILRISSRDVKDSGYPCRGLASTPNLTPPGRRLDAFRSCCLSSLTSSGTMSFQSSSASSAVANCSSTIRPIACRESRWNVPSTLCTRACSIATATRERLSYRETSLRNADLACGNHKLRGSSSSRADSKRPKMTEPAIPST